MLFPLRDRWLCVVDTPYYTEEHGYDSIECQMEVEVPYGDVPKVGDTCFQGTIVKVIRRIGSVAS